MKYLPLSSKLFIQNRERFCKKLKNNALAIFQSNDEFPRSGDQNFVFRQSPDLYWLSGIDQEQTILVLFPDCPDARFRCCLFLRQTNDHIKVWEGHKYTKEEAAKVSGIPIESIFWLQEFPTMERLLIHWSEHIYLNSNENDRYDHSVTYRDQRYAQDLQNRYPLHTYHRSAVIMRELRAVKSDLEIAALQEAIDITRAAFLRVLKFVKPGVMEYEIEAEIIHEFIRRRATGHAYTPIIASGENANILHYNDNNRECKKGDVLLMDFGAEYANYNADLSRSIPVSGRFTKRQREVYDAVHRVMKAAKKLLVPGNTWDEYHQEVGKIMESELIGLKLLDKAEVKKQDPLRPLYKKYFPHGTSHHLGLDVHDFAYRHAKMVEGNVFTVEPGIYIPEEGLGIRLENNVVIGKKAVTDLMAKIPLDAEEIEDLMNSK